MSITYDYNLKWVDRDDLTAGDPDKTIIAQDFEDEWIKIQTAFASAAPAASPTFTGTVTTGNLTASGTVSLNGLTYPAADGTADQVLVTNGTGTLSFADAAGGVDGIVSSANATAMTINSSEQVGIGVSPSTSYSEKLQVSTGIKLTSTGADYAAGQSGGYYGHYSSGPVSTTSSDTFLKSYNAYEEAGTATSGDVTVASGSSTAGNVEFLSENAVSGDVLVYTGSAIGVLILDQFVTLSIEDIDVLEQNDAVRQVLGGSRERQAQAQCGDKADGF